MEKTNVFERMKINKLKKEVDKHVEANDILGLFSFYSKLKNKDKIKVSSLLEDIIVKDYNKIEMVNSRNGIKNPFNINLLKIAGVKFEGEGQVDNKVDYLVVLLSLANNEELGELLSFYLNNCDEVFDVNYYRDMFKAILGNKYFDILKESHIDYFTKHGIFALEAKEVIANPNVLKTNKIMVLSPEELPRDFILMHHEVLNAIYTNNLLLRSFTAEEIMQVPELLNYPEITITNGEKLSKRFILKHPEVLHKHVNNLDFNLSFDDIKNNTSILENEDFHKYLNFKAKLEYFLEVPELFNIESFTYKDFQTSMLFEYLESASEMLPYTDEEQKNTFKKLVSEKVSHHQIDNTNNTYEINLLGLLPFIKMIEDAKKGISKEQDSLDIVDQINNLFEKILNIEKTIDKDYASVIENIYFDQSLILGIHGGSARVEQYLDEGIMNRMAVSGDDSLLENPAVKDTVLLEIGQDEKQLPIWEFLGYSDDSKNTKSVVLAIPKDALYPSKDRQDIALWHSIGLNKHNEYISFLPNNYIAGVYDTQKTSYYINSNYNPNILYEVKELEDKTKMVADASFLAVKTKFKTKEL